MRDILIEIGTEEMPPLALPRLSEAFAAGVVAGLAELGFTQIDSQAFATPRRLAVYLRNVPEQQAEQRLERRGPAVAAAFDADGQPTKAAAGFARSCGVSVAELEQRQTDKGAWLYYQGVQAGRKTRDELAGIVTAALNALPIPKKMRWGSGDAEFVRPVHWAVLLYGEECIAADILGVRSDRISYGHRFHAPHAIRIENPAEYAQRLLHDGKVVVDFAARRAQIKTQLLAAAEQIGGRLDLSADADLLDEVTALVEWPVAISCRFDATFLRVPAEALVSAMKSHQKYFPVYDSTGRLSAHFIAISNIDSRDPEVVRVGNERVIRPRLADAAFFWDQDRKQALAEYNTRLQTVIYQQQLGTVLEKAQRVAAVAAELAKPIGADPKTAQRAGWLCKADLMTAMVGEFPKLQGVMGRYYALASGDTDTVANAIEEHYRPRYAGDALPPSPAGQSLALADKLDTLVGIFAIGQKPSGEKDPFALRRAAIGVLRILIEGRLPLDIYTCLQRVAAEYPAALNASSAVDAVFDFLLARLRAEYESETHGYTPQELDAVLACRPTQPLDIDKRLRAVRAFSQLPDADSLAAANKRIANILKKTDVDSGATVDETLLQDAAEKTLYQQLRVLLPTIEPLIQSGDYTAALQQLAGLRPAVDGFFADVFVMSDDPALRGNRLALLTQLHHAFTAVADIAYLQ